MQRRRRRKNVGRIPKFQKTSFHRVHIRIRYTTIYKEKLGEKMKKKTPNKRSADASAEKRGKWNRFSKKNTRQKR